MSECEAGHEKLQSIFDVSRIIFEYESPLTGLHALLFIFNGKNVFLEVAEVYGSELLDCLEV